MTKCNDCWCEHYSKDKGNCDKCLKNEINKDKPDLRVILKERVLAQMKLADKNTSKGQIH